MHRSVPCLTALLSMAVLPLAAQTWAPDSAFQRLAWGTVNVLVRSDSTAGVRLWAETSSLDYSGKPLAFVASFDPDSVNNWLTQAKAIISYKKAPSNDSVQALQTHPLRAADSSQVILVRRRKKSKWENQATLLFVDPGARHPWTINAKLDEADRFIQVAFHQAGRSGWRPVTDSSWVHVANPLVESTCPAPLPGNPGVIFPPGLYGASGAVWMTFVVRADGTPDEKSFHAVLFDHPAFADAAFEALRHSRYRPGTYNGRPVPVLVSQKVLFKTAR
jgi:hypothetical protein